MVGEESCVVGGQEGDPDEQCGGHGEENVPGFVEVVWEFAGDEGQDGAQDHKEEVVGERDEEADLVLLTMKFHILQGDHRHCDDGVRRPEENGDGT